MPCELQTRLLTFSTLSELYHLNPPSSVSGVFVFSVLLPHYWQKVECLFVCFFSSCVFIKSKHADV